MPYGEPNEQPGERTFLSFEDVVKFYSYRYGSMEWKNESTNES